MSTVDSPHSADQACGRPREDEGAGESRGRMLKGHESGNLGFYSVFISLFFWHGAKMSC